MARMKKEDLQRIVHKDMPGYQLARKREPFLQSDSDESRNLCSDAGTPSLESLRRKYLNAETDAVSPPDTTDAPQEPEPPSAPEPNANADEDEIVAVEPESGRDPWDPAGRPKAVVISGKGKRIVGRQG